MYLLSKIASILDCEPTLSLPITTCVIDSRLAENGSLFFALTGEKTDGHHHLLDAAKNGAIAAVIRREYNGPLYGLIPLRVNDVKASLHLLAKKILEERQTKVIGITGSLGKTSTRECLVTLLKEKYKIHAPIHNYNSQAMMPLVVLGAKGDEDYLVLEMSMSEKGHIRKLVDIAPPEIVILTQIAIQHFVHFSSIEEIAEAKSEIFTPHTKFAVIHEKSIGFDVVVNSCTVDKMIYPHQHDIPSPFIERHLSENFSAAILVALHLGMTREEIKRASKNIKPFKSRFEKKQIKGATVIDDTYNASFVSVMAAVENMPKGKRNLFVFGSMKELKEYSEKFHDAVGNAAFSVMDQIYCLGNECRPIVEMFRNRGKIAYLAASDRELFDIVKEEVQEGDVVLIKGSRADNLTRLVEELEGRV